MINVVILNGGRGAINLIKNLLNVEGVNITSVVNGYDDGKSTGVIRDFYKMLGPSDIRKVQEAFLPQKSKFYKEYLHLYTFRYSDSITSDEVKTELSSYVNFESDLITGIKLNDYQFDKSIRNLVSIFLNSLELIEKGENKKFNFSDCSIMNILYSAAFLKCKGNFEDTIVFIDKLFRLKGTVLSTNNENKKLIAIREDGTILYSEAEIVELRSNSRIKKIFLVDEYPNRDFVSKMQLHEIEQYFDFLNRQVTITPKVKRSIDDADIIIYSSGTQHSSLYPSYITKGLTNTIASNTKALKIFVTNIGEDYETPSYSAYDYIYGALKYLRLGTDQNVLTSNLIDYALVNNCFKYKKIENYVLYDENQLSTLGCKILIDSFEDENNFGKHDGLFLANYIMDLYDKRQENPIK